MEDALKDLTITLDLDRWPWLSIPERPLSFTTCMPDMKVKGPCV